MRAAFLLLVLSSGIALGGEVQFFKGVADCGVVFKGRDFQSFSVTVTNPTNRVVTFTPRKGNPR